jgi:hypothetical protein
MLHPDLSRAKKRHVWTTTEAATLKTAARESWELSRVCEALSHLNKDQIKAQLTHRHLQLRKGLKPLGVAALDAVRSKAYLMNLSLGDLDEICGGGMYWQRCVRRASWWRVEKAAAYMGGQLIVL